MTSTDTSQAFGLLLIGAGGHARVVADTLAAQRAAHPNVPPVVGYLDANPDLWGRTVDGLPVLGSDADLTPWPPDRFRLVIAVGSVRAGGLRARLYDRFAALGYAFQTVQHPTAWVSPRAVVAPGAQLFAGVVVQTGAHIGANAILNTRVAVDHDCRIGQHVHLAPGVVLSGNVTVREGAHLGTGSTVIQGVEIGAGATVGAGSVVIGPVPAGATVYGVPASSKNQETGNRKQET